MRIKAQLRVIEEYLQPDTTVWLQLYCRCLVHRSCGYNAEQLLWITTSLSWLQRSWIGLNICLWTEASQTGRGPCVPCGFDSIRPQIASLLPRAWESTGLRYRRRHSQVHLYAKDSTHSTGRRADAGWGGRHIPHGHVPPACWAGAQSGDQRLSVPRTSQTTRSIEPLNCRK